jgi:hypothetical protein
MSEEIKMPKRLRGRQRLDSTPVQDEGSWVEISPLKYSESKQVSKDVRLAEKGGDFLKRQEIGDKLLSEHVHAWNWVDEEGNDLPQPPEGLDECNTAEINWLSDELMGLGQVEAKN